ncbi:programmed cell death protein 2 [Orussus abietinus]|uniref:programmed cell death protein 2 n=1 Tax=Orussus abietinus TaxID=222816 RepID=UPI000626E393|nr:programmed cell death protein 2 [Orussus abietinus]
MQEKGKVDIGFVEECESWRLNSRFFPSKVGGKPAWLDLKNIPSKETLECEICKNPCIFLCQIYAPYEDDPNAFHRMIYIFVCKRIECCKTNQVGNFKVVRSQLAKENQFYPSEPPEEKPDWNTDLGTSMWAKLCHVCGILAPSHCSKCKKVHYCCRLHQVMDWKNGHKELCGTENLTPTDKFLFPEYELTIEMEEKSDEEMEVDNVNDEAREIKKYKKLVADGKAGTLQHEPDVDSDLQRMSNSLEDETFSEFCARLKQYPDQVLRYDRGGKPLYISSEHQPERIPRCIECKEERQLEFQVMPQLLNYLQFEDVFHSLDWGILAVYTCKKSCIPKSGYVEEYLWKQDIVHNEENNASEDNTS